MCNNRFPLNSQEDKHYRFLGECAAMLLQGKDVQEIADSKNVSIDELTSQMKELKQINPFLYEQIKMNL